MSKGSKNRTTNLQDYRENFDSIDFRDKRQDWQTDEWIAADTKEKQAIHFKTLLDAWDERTEIITTGVLSGELGSLLPIEIDEYITKTAAESANNFKKEYGTQFKDDDRGNFFEHDLLKNWLEKNKDKDPENYKDSHPKLYNLIKFKQNFL